jgi:hypothetical protein
MSKPCDMFTADDGEEVPCTALTCATIRDGIYTALIYLNFSDKNIEERRKCGQNKLAGFKRIIKVEK